MSSARVVSLAAAAVSGALVVGCSGASTPVAERASTSDAAVTAGTVADVSSTTSAPTVAQTTTSVDPSMTAVEPGAAARPFPQHVEYASGALRPTNVSQDEMDAATAAAYGTWIDVYLRTDGSDGAWIEYDGAGSTVSEAHGYGMVLAAYFADRETFDSLHTYYLEHPSNLGEHLMAWKQTLMNGEMTDVAGPGSATDGDLDIAYALLLADAQWGSAGDIDYLATARALLADIDRWDVNHELSSLTVGNWVTGEDRDYTRPSDFMVSHLLAFARHDPEHADTWQAVYDQIVRAVDDVVSGPSVTTGLMPDFLHWTGSAWEPVVGTWLETEYDGDFWWNACRTPWRLTMPWLVDERTDLLAPTRLIADWAATTTDGEPGAIHAGYFVGNGPPGTEIVADDYELAFTAPMAVNAMTGQGPDAQEWMNATWSSITGGDFPAVTEYYGDALRLQAMLAGSGNWWAP